MGSDCLHVLKLAVKLNIAPACWKCCETNLSLTHLYRLEHGFWLNWQRRRWRWFRINKRCRQSTSISKILNSNNQSVLDTCTSNNRLSCQQSMFTVETSLHKKNETSGSQFCLAATHCHGKICSQILYVLFSDVFFMQKIRSTTSALIQQETTVGPMEFDSWPLSFFTIWYNGTSQSQFGFHFHYW